jgi:hypothetical protein
MAMGLIRATTEMSTRNRSGGKAQPVRKADYLTPAGTILQPYGPPLLETQLYS